MTPVDAARLSCPLCGASSKFGKGLLDEKSAHGAECFGCGQAWLIVETPAPAVASRNGEEPGGAR
mgnify:CR=1 FL=1